MKCFAVGMQADCVVPEDQCLKKRMAKNKMNNSGISPASVLSMQQSPPHGPANNGLKKPNDIDPPLKPEEEELINRLVYFQLEYESPKEEDLKKVYNVPLLPIVTNNTGGSSSNAENKESESLFRHITEMTMLTVNLIVEFCKHLPGFASLEKDDKVVILKGCSSEVMMLRAARR